ncbi:MAG TPA: MFS transporter [Caulobacterales bacterium]|nr:MFS transporter [Caulobacterales bacterium]
MLRIPSLAIFRHRAYARFWFGRIMATLAIQMQTTAIGWQIYNAARAEGRTIEQASFVLGVFGLSQFLPLLVLSPFGGQFADRYDRKLIAMACVALKALVALGLAFASGLPPSTLIPVILCAAVATGVLNAFLPPAISALLPMLVPRAELPQAIAWSSLSFQASLIVGPAFGGLLYGLGDPVPYAATFALLALAAALILSTPAPKQAPATDPRTLGMIVEGLRFVWSNKIVLGAISLDLVVVLLGGAVALLPVFARDFLHAGPSEMGVLRGSMGAGAALVALALAVQPIRRNVGKWMFGATILFGMAMLAFGLSHWFWVSSAALFVAGGVDMVSVFVRQSLIQLATPDAMRGRVAAVSFVFISASNELGDFESGVMARIFGPILAVVIGGVASIGASLGWMKLFPQLAAADGFESQIAPEPEPAPAKAAE